MKACARLECRSKYGIFEGFSGIPAYYFTQDAIKRRFNCVLALPEVKKVADYGEYLEVSEDLNLRIMDIVTKVERGKLHLLIVMGMPTPLTSVTVVWYIIVRRIKAPRSQSVSPTE